MVESIGGEAKGAFCGSDIRIRESRVGVEAAGWCLLGIEYPVEGRTTRGGEGNCCWITTGRVVVDPISLPGLDFATSEESGRRY